MPKELPYFKFEPAEYLTKDVSFCSLSAQGLFINICAYYWQRNCELTKGQLLRRLNYENEFNELISEGIIDLKGENISIKFLNNQLEKTIELSEEQSRKGKLGGRPKKPNESQTKAEQKPNESHKIREDKIIEEDIKDNGIDEIEKIKIIYDRFVQEIKEGKHQIAIESIYMRLRVKKGTLQKILEDYKGQIIIDRKLHKTTLEVLKHFNNYCNTQDRIGKLDEYKTTKLKGAL